MALAAKDNRLLLCYIQMSIVQRLQGPPTTQFGLFLCALESMPDESLEGLLLIAALRDDPFSVSGDLHGLMGGAPPEIRPVGDIAAWHQKLCTSSSGVLYEDTYLQARTISMVGRCA